MCVSYIYLQKNKEICLGPPGQSQPRMEQQSGPSQLPYPTQFQGAMPVPYGAGPTTPYPTYVPPPMPTTYNPYATMPYPAQGNLKMRYHS